MSEVHSERLSQWLTLMMRGGLSQPSSTCPSFDPMPHTTRTSHDDANCFAASNPISVTHGKRSKLPPASCRSSATNPATLSSRGISAWCQTSVPPIGMYATAKKPTRPLGNVLPPGQSTSPIQNFSTLHCLPISLQRASQCSQHWHCCFRVRKRSRLMRHG